MHVGKRVREFINSLRLGHPCGVLETGKGERSPLRMASGRVGMHFAKRVPTLCANAGTFAQDEDGTVGAGLTRIGTDAGAHVSDSERRTEFT